MKKIKAFLFLSSPIWLGYLFGALVTNDPDAIMVISMLSAIILAFGLDKIIQSKRDLDNMRNEIK